MRFLTILEGDDAMTAKPVFATADERAIQAATDAVAAVLTGARRPRPAPIARHRERELAVTVPAAGRDRLA